MERKKSKIIVAILMIVVIGCISCGGRKGNSGKIKVDGIESKVQKVLSGNKIELQNGLKVTILGILPTEHTKQYLEKFVKGETIVIISDSKQRQFVKSYKTEINAYVKVKGDGYCLAGKLLLAKKAELRETSVKDSLVKFRAYVRDSVRPLMTLPELKEYMKPATFLIKRADGGSGTGFFINDNGLALTNNHVLDGSQDAIIYYFGENGKIDETNYRTIHRYLLTNEDAKVDFTVFYVQLDKDEKVHYMPLVKNHIKEGEQIAKIGCPVGLKCDFGPGILSTYYDGFFSHKIASNHGDSGGPIANMRGEIVGVNQSIEFNPSLSAMTGTMQKAEGIAYGVDAVLIREVLDKYEIEYGR